MAETDYNVATKKGQSFKAVMNAKAKKQIAAWENLPKNVSWLSSCAICGRTRIESRMTFYVDDEVFVCKEGCETRYRNG